MSPRNEFEQNIPLDEKSKTVPLRLGVGGPIIGTATVDEHGNVTLGEITDPDVKESLRITTEAFSIRDPADKYRVSPEQDEMDVPFGRPPQ